jgi:NAD(P)-dependent dehydrogenase (short-subunit alcohol dehydrogenase family)
MKMASKPLCAVIGAGLGVGAGIARRFAKDGYRLALFSRSGAAEVAQTLSNEGCDATGYSLDAGDFDAVTAAIASLGTIEVLAWNAAAFSVASPSKLPAQNLVDDFKVTVAGAVAAIQSALPAMPFGKASILLTGGGFALYPSAQMFSLGIGKASIRNLASTLFQELQPKGIRAGTVTIMGTVAPGTAFDADKIADAFHSIHVDRAGKLGPEIEFKG